MIVLIVLHPLICDHFQKVLSNTSYSFLQLNQLVIPEPDDADRKKKTLKSKIKGSKPSHGDSNKPNISYPTNFEHTVHVGFDAVTGEFTVSFNFVSICLSINFTLC